MLPDDETGTQPGGTPVVAAVGKLPGAGGTVVVLVEVDVVVAGSVDEVDDVEVVGIVVDEGVGTVVVAVVVDGAPVVVVVVVVVAKQADSSVPSKRITRDPDSRQHWPLPIAGYERGLPPDWLVEIRSPGAASETKKAPTRKLAASAKMSSRRLIIRHPCRLVNTGGR